MSRKLTRLAIVLFLSGVLSIPIFSSPPRIRILATGGTISAVQSQPAGSSFKSGRLSVQTLIASVPDLDKLASLSMEQVCNIGSQTMNNEIWLKLARRVNEVLTDPNVDGVVITHGTDTMEETAYFLSLVVHSEKPVVMVGAMRPATALSADGPMNIYNGVALAANPNARGRRVLVVSNDEIHYAREVAKKNNIRVDALDSPDRGRAGIINAGAAVLFGKLASKYGASSEFQIENVRDLPRVEIVYSYANFGREMIDFLARSRVKGIVLAGVGNGNTTDEVLVSLSDAARNGIAVVRSTRVYTGFTRRNVEIDDDKLGFIASGELSAPKARILLMLALTRTHDVKELQRYFDEY